MSDPFQTSVIVSPGVAPPAAVLEPLPVLKHRDRRLRAGSAPGYSRGGGAGWGYQGAQNTRAMSDWITQHFSGDSAIAHGWDNITRRARDLVRNEPWAAQAVSRIPQNVIGAEGIASQSEIELDDGTLDVEAGQQLDTWFERWAADQADAEGEIDFAELQSLVMGEAPEVGECFLVEVNDPDPKRIIPLCYQVFEPEQINDSLWGTDPATGNRIKRGIEFDRYGRRAAYHFWTEHPYDLLVVANDTVRVPAGRVIHYYEKHRPSQTRGVTWFAPILQTMRDLSEYTGSEMTAARLGSMFTVAIKRANGIGTGLGFGEEYGDSMDRDSNPLEYLGPGIIADLGKDDSVEQIESKRPNSGAEGWIKLILNSMANGLGMTYLGLTGDTKEASFSSARFAQNKDKLFWKTLQGRFGRKVVLRIRRRAVTQMVARGLVSITPTQFKAAPFRWLATRLLPPGWEEIQVDAEVNAAIRRIQGGLSTLQEECAGRGRNWRRILQQRAREMALVKELGLDLTTNYAGNVSASAAPGGAAGGVGRGAQGEDAVPADTGDEDPEEAE